MYRRRPFQIIEAEPLPVVPVTRMYPYLELEPGQCFQMAHEPGLAQRVRMAAYAYCRRVGIPNCFVVRVAHDRGKPVIRCWRLGDPTAPTTTQDPNAPGFTPGG